MHASQNILVLTGSGISAESGISTYRGGEEEGLWSQVDFEKYASPEGFAEDPIGVHEFYNLRRAQIRTVAPNPAHFALARLQAHMRSYGGSLTLVTQNVDDLHERAGAETLHMHGEILKGFCGHCNSPRFEVAGDLAITDACTCCGEIGGLRPDVVWFGEMPYHMDEILDQLDVIDMFVSIGTSGAVYPASGFVDIARRKGLPTIELNLEPSDNAHAFTDAIYGRAATIVPEWVSRWGV
ncbi:MAG: NAD-dependent deacylase [Alphaproteobacteria bacterium]|nr:NAD-dependent deacylase [Alphaproteobacteria bacterium]